MERKNLLYQKEFNLTDSPNSFVSSKTVGDIEEVYLFEGIMTANDPVKAIALYTELFGKYIHYVEELVNDVANSIRRVEYETFVMYRRLL